MPSLPDLNERRERTYSRTPSPIPPLIRRDIVARWIYWSRTMRPDVPGLATYGEPGWNMLLDLYIHEKSGKRLGVTALSIGSNAPATTALRYINALVEAGWFERHDDSVDQRRAFIALSAEATRVLDDYIDEVTTKLWDIVPEGLRHPRLDELEQVCDDLRQVVSDLKQQLAAPVSDRELAPAGES